MSGLLIDNFWQPAHNKNVELRLAFRLVKPRKDFAVQRQEKIKFAVSSATNCKRGAIKKSESVQVYSSVGAVLKLPIAKYA